MFFNTLIFKYLHPSDDVLVDDLPELELGGDVIVDVVDDPHLVADKVLILSGKPF